MSKPTHYYAVFVHRLITTTCYLTVQPRKPSLKLVERWGGDLTGAQKVIVERISEEAQSMLIRLKEAPGYSVKWLKRPANET